MLLVDPRKNASGALTEPYLVQLVLALRQVGLNVSVGPRLSNDQKNRYSSSNEIIPSLIVGSKY